MTLFKVGDRVRLTKGTMLWTSRPDLKEKSGEVTALVDDGTKLERITVAFDGAVEFEGIYAGVFDRMDAPWLMLQPVK